MNKIKQKKTFHFFVNNLDDDKLSLMRLFKISIIQLILMTKLITWNGEIIRKFEFAQWTQK